MTGRFAMSWSSSAWSRSCASWDSQVASRSVVDTLRSPRGWTTGIFNGTSAGVSGGLPNTRTDNNPNRPGSRGPAWIVGRVRHNGRVQDSHSSVGRSGEVTQRLRLMAVHAHPDD